MNDHACLENTL